MLQPVSPLMLRCISLLPLDLDDCVTDYQVLCKIITKMREVLESNNQIITQVNASTQDIINLTNEVNYLEGEIEKIKHGEYISVYIDALACWINNNLICLVGRVVKYVVFGLDDNGYFYADVPSPWCIQFDTIVTPDENYGRLVLEY